MAAITFYITIRVGQSGTVYMEYLNSYSDTHSILPYSSGPTQLLQNFSSYCTKIEWTDLNIRSSTGQYFGQFTLFNNGGTFYSNYVQITQSNGTATAIRAGSSSSSSITQKCNSTILRTPSRQSHTTISQIGYWDIKYTFVLPDYVGQTAASGNTINTTATFLKCMGVNKSTGTVMNDPNYITVFTGTGGTYQTQFRVAGEQIGKRMPNNFNLVDTPSGQNGGLA